MKLKEEWFLRNQVQLLLIKNLKLRFMCFQKKKAEDILRFSTITDHSFISEQLT